MSVVLLVSLGLALLAVAAIVVWLRYRRVTIVLVAADPESALLSSAAALRRLGARITRYDTEAGTLEARVPPLGHRVRLRTTIEDAATTRVRVEGDASTVVRRFRESLST
jgi:hypothetical protein